MLPLTIILEPLSESVILGALVSWAVSTLFFWSPLAFFFVHCLVWFLMDYILLLVVQVWRFALIRSGTSLPTCTSYFNSIQLFCFVSVDVEVGFSVESVSLMAS